MLTHALDVLGNNEVNKKAGKRGRPSHCVLQIKISESVGKFPDYKYPLHTEVPLNHAQVSLPISFHAFVSLNQMSLQALFHLGSC